MFKKIFGFGEIEMPTAKYVIICSWLVFFFCMISGFYYLLSGFFRGAIWMCLGIVILLFLRLLANIGDLFLKQNKLMSYLLQEMSKINCDSADINRSLLDIKDFFADVQKKLDLKG